MHAILARNWWAFALRGVLGILFGIVALAWPRVMLGSLVIVFAAYAVVDGIFAIVASWHVATRHGRWLPFLLEGIVSLLAGVLAFLWPGFAVVVFVLMVAIWALITGGLLLVAAFRLGPEHGRWWFALGGLASLVYGVLLIAMPGVGAVVLTLWIGAYALVFGAAMLVGALRLRAHA